MNRPFARTALVLGLALLMPGCSALGPYPDDRYSRHGRVDSTFDEGFRHGIIDGRWAGHRDEGRPYRRNFWDDPRYRHGTEGYRPQYGSRAEYANGFRSGYERGYRERRDRERYERGR